VQVWGRGARVGWYRRTGDRVYWFAVANTAEARDRSDGAPSNAADVRSRFASWPDPVGHLVAATPEHAISRVNTYDRAPVTTWGRGAVTLLGDAAHPMTFNVGQGACQAIEDGAALAIALAREPGDTAGALRGYEVERMARTAPMMRRARVIGALGRWQNPVACAARNRLLGPVLAGPAARQARAMTSHGCDDVAAVPATASLPVTSQIRTQKEVITNDVDNTDSH
jgi:2-polyprenyl-6-methoxyphenol hydroxylase-like FAD-dependent oxidoreductase